MYICIYVVIQISDYQNLHFSVFGVVLMLLRALALKGVDRGQPGLSEKTQVSDRVVKLFFTNNRDENQGRFPLSRTKPPSPPLTSGPGPAPCPPSHMFN